MKEKSQNTTSKIWDRVGSGCTAGALAGGFHGRADSQLYAALPGGCGEGFCGGFRAFNGKCKGNAFGGGSGTGLRYCRGISHGGLIMERFEKLYKAFYPLIVLTQTIPTVAIAAPFGAVVWI